MKWRKLFINVILSAGMLVTGCLINPDFTDVNAEEINLDNQSERVEAAEPGISLGFETDSENPEILAEPMVKEGETAAFYTEQPTTKLTYNGTYQYDYSWEVLNIVNSKRKALGLSTLTMDKELHEAAMLRAAEINAYFDHTRPDGSSCFTVSEKAWGENIAAGYYSAEAVMTGWENSPGHWGNITNSRWSSIGIGCFTQGNVLYWVQLFGEDKAELSSLKTNQSVQASINLVTKYVDLSFNIIDDYHLFVQESVEVSPRCTNAGWDRFCVELSPSIFTWRRGNNNISVTSSAIVTGQKQGRAYLQAELKSNPAYILKTYFNITDPCMPLEATNIKATPDGKNRVRLSWDPVTGYYNWNYGRYLQKADGYIIYASKNGKRAYCGMTSQKNDYYQVEFVDTKASDTDYNFYWVYPYAVNQKGERVIGPCKNYVYAKGTLKPVDMFTGSSTKQGVKLSWTKVNGATGYLIYGKKNGKPYGYIGMTGKTYYTDTTAATNQYSFYWVIPYHKSASGKVIPGSVSRNYIYGKKVK